MALRFSLKKTCSSLARSGALFHASAPAAAARPISDGVRTLNNVCRGVLQLHPSSVMPNNIGLCGLATRHLSTSPCPHAAAAKISCPRTGMPSININHIKSASVNSSRGALRTYSSRATVESELSQAAQMAASGASYRNFLKGVRLAACALSLVWAITIYSVWSKRRRCSCNGLRGCNGRRGHSKSYEIRRCYTSL
ncbi:uncharacterized protein LOC124667617 [Lolium rigidum]|uniref:uncharacterized protein LOC124667617 n=1 Tax=Lolium rigidum TaxID=89674 RepID=UPI001F5E3214|nr:uncharacterized protein LOC124667617 [Lolium rigidum]